jgi:hypothetical protein
MQSKLSTTMISLPSVSRVGMLWAVGVILSIFWGCGVSVSANGVQYNVDCNDEITVDYAMVQATNLPANQAIYGLNRQCYQCSHVPILSTEGQCSMVYSPFEWTLYLMNTETNATDAKTAYTFGDQGSYAVYNSASSLKVDILEDPVNSLAPVWIMMGVFIAVGILAFVGPRFYEQIVEKYWPDYEHGSSQTSPLLANETFDTKARQNDDLTRRSVTSRQSLKSHPSADDLNQTTRGGDEVEAGASMGRGSITSNTSGSRHSAHSLADIPIANQVANAAPSVNAVAASSPPAPKSKPPRLNSLDTFRGFSLCIMIFVNYGGGGYWFFNHAPWHGLTLADLVFPWFMWMMGVSMALSFSALGLVVADPVVSNASGTLHAPEYQPAPWSAWAKVVQRAMILFGLGLFLNDGNDYKNWRIPGVLQYFGVSYFVTSMTVLYYLPTTNVRRQFS